MASKSAEAAPKPEGASRPSGTDGSDYSYRMTVDYRYKRSAAIKQRLAAVCRAHLSLGFLALAWAVAVPLMRGKTALPLPCTTSATAIFCAVSGSGIASGRITQHSLDQFVKLSKAALFLGVLAFFLPRYKLVPGGPSAEAAGLWLAQQLGMPAASVTAATAQLDNAMEGALWVLPLMEWWYATSLRSVLGDSLPQRKKRA